MAKIRAKPLPMPTYRPFRNDDPPKILRLWHDCELGRGAAEGFDTDAFELTTFCQPYFDRAGLILAEENGEVVGAVHGGFEGVGQDHRLNSEIGVVCLLLVHPDHRGRGVGKGLLASIEDYFRGRGAGHFQAGAANPNDPFYFGLYGGARPAGILESDSAAGPFLQKMGYTSGERFGVFQRDISKPNDPVSVRLMSIRRKVQLAVTDEPDFRDWWWMTRYGRHETARFFLVPKSGGDPLAGVSIVDLYFYLPKWQERAMGLMNLHVEERERRKGYAQALLIEVCKRLRQELITRIEVHAPENNETAITTFESAGFSRVDTGVVYVRDA